MNGLHIVLLIAVLVVVATAVVFLKKGKPAGGKKSVRKSGNGFQTIMQQENFQDTGKDLGEVTALLNGFDGHHMSSTDFKETIKKVQRCLKKEEANASYYLANLSIIRSSGNGKPDEVTTLFINHRHKIRGKIFIRPKLSEVLENSFSYAIKNHPNILVKNLPDPVHGLMNTYSVFLFNMAQDLGKKIMSPDVQRILLKHASNFPMNYDTEEVPGVVIADHALFITSGPTGEEKDLTELLAFGRELVTGIDQAIEEAERKEAAQIEAEKANEGGEGSLPYGP